MLSFFYLFYSIFGWIVCTIAFSTHMLVVLIFAPFVKDPIGFNIACTRPIIRCALWILRIKVHVEHADYIPTDQSFIIVANHQSHVDIPAILLAIPRPFGFIAKKELLNVPIVGWVIRSQGHIAIDRSNPVQAKNQLEALVSSIASNQKNLVIFAEGTRSATGKLGKFKIGAFDLAAKSGAMIIPASISGSFGVLSKRSMEMRPGTITIRFSPPVHTPKSATRRELEQVRIDVVAAISESMSRNV